MSPERVEFLQDRFVFALLCLVGLGSAIGFALALAGRI